MLGFKLNSHLLIVLSVFLAVTDVHAANFTFDSEINARVIYDDNVTESAVNEESSSIYMVTPKVKLNYHSDSWDSAMNAHIKGTSYSEQYQNQIDSYLDFETAYKNDRSIYSIVGGYNNYSNRTAEENIIGLPTEQVETTKLSLAPEYTHLLTERTSLSLAYSYADVGVDTNLGNYLPYETQSAIGEIAYNLSQKSDLSLVLAVEDYTSENNIVEYQMLSSKIGFVHDLSRTLSAKVFVGANSTDITTRSSQNFVFSGSTVTGTQEVETSRSGEIFEAAIDAKWIELGISRDTVSNTTGGLDRTDRIRAKLRMQVTSLIGLVLSVNRVKVDEVNDNVIDYSRSYTTIVPAMNLSLARNLDLRGEYIIMKTDYVDSTRGTVDKSRLAVNLTYTFPSI